MRKFLFVLIIVSFFIAFYNQTKEKPNVFITAIAVIVFMFGMMKFSSKLPSKNQDKDGKDI